MPQQLNHLRSSHPEVFYKMVAMEHFAKLTGKHLLQTLFFNEVADLRVTALSKRNSGTVVFQ